VTRSISRQQVFEQWVEGGFNRHGCMVCGGGGYADTRGKVFNSKGEDVGGEFLCFCPEGDELRRKWRAEVRRSYRGKK
jgi:hypothetical protein